MEKIVVFKYSDIIQNSLPSSQAGFRPGLEINDQLLRVLTPIEHAVNNRGFASVIAALDVQKAFDTMWHDGLRLKLTLLNFPIVLVRWISNFLHYRKAKVKCSETLSEVIDMEAGAPQGSAISPTLYNLFVYDIPQPTDERIGLAQFADDTCLWAIAAKTDMACRLLNRQLTTYTNWTKKWRITVNADKTQTMLIRRKRKRQRTIRNNPILIDKSPVTFTNKLKYLGITLTDKLTLTDHVKQILGRTTHVIKTLALLARKNNLTTNKTRLYLYKSLLRSSLTFAAPLLLNLTHSQKQKLLKRERKALRICLAISPLTPSRIIHNLANIEPIDFYIRETCKKYHTRASNKAIVQELIDDAPPNTTAFNLKNLPD